ncbi:MAG: hypothetical protein D5R98_05845 [Desulfonatronovibrio sp. MSAO_Bac4]|nr:MAG: hypothetical protein D5R98_05845 [Desulfonatronovibrio sp. MSAO_Bac4]
MSDKKDAYVQKLKGKLDELNAEFDKISARADQAEGDAKIRYQEQMKDLREKRLDMEKTIESLKDAGDSSWEDMKQGLEDSWATWKESFSKAKSEFKKAYKEERDK